MDSTISMGQVKNLLNYTIDNNLKLQDKGVTPIAIALEATAGIGKSAIVEQVAESRGMTYTKLNLAQLEEAGDLTGFPIVEFECQTAKLIKNEDGTIKRQILPGTVWLTSKQMDNLDKNTFRQTGKHRMAYSKPAWVPEYNENGVVLNLDDYTRANQQLLQATMQLIQDQSYVSWKLPKKTSIFLTTNSDDGMNNVNSLDEAQSSRFLTFNVEFDLDAWMNWAEGNEVDGRCINFVASYSQELFNADEDGNHICNPRSFVLFSNMISGIKDWDNPESLSFINTIAKGCFKDEGGRFAKMFTAFLRNKMHLLIQPKEMLLGSWEKVRNTMESTIYDSDGNYRPDIASLLERRFSSYVNAWLSSDKKTPIETVKNRILDFLNNPDNGGRKFFNSDLMIHMIKTITSDHKNQTNKLLYEPKIAKILS